MVESSSKYNITNFSKCNHIKSLYNSTYHPILNPHVNLNSFSNLNLNKSKFNNLKIRPNSSLEDFYFFNKIDESWIAYHNNQSLNHQMPTASEGCIFHVEFTKSGNYMAASNHFNIIEVWDMNKRKLIKSVNLHREIVTGIDFFTDPSYVQNQDSSFENEFMLSCSLDKTIKLSKNFKVLHTFTEHADWLRCLNVSSSTKNFLSGCISSTVKYWDLETRSVIFSIDSPASNNDTLNTVNTVKFFDNDNLFLTAFREGNIKIYDIRNNNKIPVANFKAHMNKLNCGKLSKDFTYLLTSGRDSCGKLWDRRNLPTRDNSIDHSKTIQTYKGHKCQGFNIEFNFIGNENYAITGSEDGIVYLYELSSGKNIKKYKTGASCINLVKPIPSIRSKYGFLYSSLEHLKITFCDIDGKNEKYEDTQINNILKSTSDNLNKNPKKEENKSKEININKIMEEVMGESGDLILKLLHRSNMNYSTELSYETIMDVIQRENNQESIQLLEQLNQKLQMKMIEAMRRQLCPENNETKTKEIQEQLININTLCADCEFDDSMMFPVQN